MPQDRTAQSFEPKITARYPIEDHPDDPLNPMILQFCYPSSETIVPTRQYEMPRVHHFVLTNDRGTKIYGTCLTMHEEYVSEDKGSWRTARPVRTDQEAEGVEVSVDQKCTLYIPKILCLLSTWSYLTAFRQYLAQLYRLASTTNVMTAPLERYIVNVCKEIPAPPPGAYEIEVSLLDTTIRFWAPPARLPIAYVALPYQVLFDCLEIDRIIYVWSALLVERKVLLLSSQYSILTVCAEIFSSFLFPLRWSHLYVPLLPRMLCPMLDAPVPYFCGISRHDWIHAQQFVSEETIVVDLDNNKVHAGAGTPPIPNLPVRKLGKLKTNVEEVVGHVFWKARGLESDYRAVMAKKKQKRNFESLQAKADSSSSSWKQRLDGLDQAFNLVYTPDSHLLESSISDQTGQTQWDRVQEAFLRFLVSVLKDYNRFLVSSEHPANSSFDSAGFVEYHKQENAAFLFELCETQQFGDFISRRLFCQNEPDMAFFDDKISEKLNRSKLKLKKADTPMLQSASVHKVLQKVQALPPSEEGLPSPKFERILKPYVYKIWPEVLDDSLLCEPRPIPRMIAAEFDRQEMLIQRLEQKDMDSEYADREGDTSSIFYKGAFDSSPEVAAFTLFFFAYCAFVGQEWQEFDQKLRELESQHRDADQAREHGGPQDIEAVLQSDSVPFDQMEADGFLSDLSLGLCSSCSDVGTTMLNKTILFCRNPEKSFSTVMRSTADQMADLQRQVVAFGGNPDLDAEIQEQEAVAVAQLDLAFEVVATMQLRQLSADSDACRSLMEACGRCGDTVRAFALMELMKKNRIAADSEILSCFVAAFAHDGVGGMVVDNTSQRGPDAYATYLEKQYHVAKGKKDPLGSLVSNDSCGYFGSEDERSTTSITQASETSSVHSSMGTWFPSEAFGATDAKKKNKMRKKRKGSSRGKLVTAALSNQLSLGRSLLDFVYPDLAIDTSFDCCPHCSMTLKEDDIVKGWTACSFSDFTTECKNCHHRFVPRFSVACSSPDFEGSQGLGTPLYCEFLSPWVLRKALHNIIKGDLGIRGILDPKWRSGSDICATLFWNFVVICQRYRLPYSFLLQGSFPNRLILPRIPANS